MIRQLRHNRFLRGFADRKDLTDELRIVDFKTDKRVDGFGVGWSWERRDGFGGGGYWSSTGALYHGRLKLRDAASEAIDKSIFGRSEEHTSELQSLMRISYAVFCLKKKKK